MQGQHLIKSLDRVPMRRQEPGGRRGSLRPWVGAQCGLDMEKAQAMTS